jgi:hypothetical protein
MTTLLIILAYVVGPFLAAFAVVLIQRRLSRRRRDVAPVKDSHEADEKPDRD